MQTLFFYSLILACGGALPQHLDGTTDSGLGDGQSGSGDELGADGSDADGDSFDRVVDCDDHDSGVFPGAQEACNGIDDDCDGLIDEDGATGSFLVYADDDGDGQGDLARWQQVCVQPGGTVENPDDCDDGDSDIHIGATEVCDGIDNNCNGLIDAADSTLFDGWPEYRDSDFDGFGDDTVMLWVCEELDGMVDQPGDCDVTASDVLPFAQEFCDPGDRDEDCDGLSDDADGSVAGTTAYFQDLDGDGFGDVSLGSTCDAPVGAVATAGDCDDIRGAVHPGAFEICNDGLDNDCDGGAGECTWAGAHDLDDADHELLGYEGQRIGTSVSILGDLDGDGLQEVAIVAPGGGPDEAGAPGDTAAVGRAYIVGPEWGRDGVLKELAEGTVDGVAAYDLNGATFVAAGDVDGDGYPDVLAGLPSVNGTTTEADGAAVIFRGPIGGSLDRLDADTMWSGGSNDALGSSVTAVGDIDGNGHNDFALGASGYGAGGAVFLVEAETGITAEMNDGSPFATLYGEDVSDQLGASMASGDADGDGIPDLLIGAPGQSTGGTWAGMAYLVLGPVDDDVDMMDANSRMYGDHTYAHAGTTVAFVGDTDGDGLEDFAVGAPYDSSAGSYAGRAYVVRGEATRGTWCLDAADATIAGDGVADLLGASVSSAGDWNADGLADLAVGAPAVWGDVYGGGAVRVFAGPIEGTLRATDAFATLGSRASSDAVGVAVAGGADLDRDGVADLVVGAPGESSKVADAGSVTVWNGLGL